MFDLVAFEKPVSVSSRFTVLTLTSDFSASAATLQDKQARAILICLLVSIDTPLSMIYFSSYEP